MLTLPTFDDIEAAAARIAPLAHRTPVLTSRSLDALAGCHLFFKCENFQRAGAFKFRGAANAVFSLPDDVASRGVVTHSSGNHAAALALAAQCRKVPCFVVLPTNAPEAKRQATLRYGAKVIPCQPNMASRESTAAQVQADTGATLVHPYDDNLVIAGQGTATLEFLEQAPRLDALLAPVSGGGLMSGTALAASHLKPSCKLFGAEPANVDDARRSLASGHVETNPPTATTIADGLRAQLSARTLAILQPRLSAILTATEDQILSATRLVWERLKIIIEPSSATPLAALLANPSPFAGKSVGLILSGGNLDLSKLPWQ